VLPFNAAITDLHQFILSLKNISLADVSHLLIDTFIALFLLANQVTNVDVSTMQFLNTF